MASIYKWLMPGLLLITAQSQLTPSQSLGQLARKFTEFRCDVSPVEMKQRLDDFALALRSDPQTQGWIYYYSGVRLPGAALRLNFIAQNYLHQTGRIENPQLGSRRGGQRPESTIELWLVPAGAKMPDPTPEQTIRDYRAAFKWDEMNYFLQEEKKKLTGKEPDSLNSNFYYDQTTWLDGFGRELRLPQTPIGLIVVFPKRGDAQDMPQQIADYQRRYLLRTRLIDPSRIGLRVGGVSETRRVELWLIPGAGPMLMAEFSPCVRETTAALDQLVHERDSITGVQAGSKIYLIAYSGSCSGQKSQRNILAQTELAEMKEYLIRKKQIDRDQIVMIDGGSQKERGVELWLVPPGAIEPKPKLPEP